MPALYPMICVVCLMAAGMAGWEFKPPDHNNRWGVFWLVLSIVCMVLIVTTYDVFVGGCE